MTDVTWQDLRFKYNVTIADNTLSYNKKLRFGGVAPLGIFSLAEKIYNKVNDELEEGEVRIKADLASCSSAALGRAAVQTYSAFSEVFMMIAGGAATYFAFTAFYVKGQSAAIQWLILLGPFAAVYLGLRWCLSNIFKHNVIIVTQKDGKNFMLDIRGIDEEGLRRIKAGLARVISFP